MLKTQSMTKIKKHSTDFNEHEIASIVNRMRLHCLSIIGLPPGMMPHLQHFDASLTRPVRLVFTEQLALQDMESIHDEPIYHTRFST